MIDLAREILGVLFAGLWQGLLIAALAAAALAGLRRVSAATHHAVLWCALLAIAAIPLITAIPTWSVAAAGLASAPGAAAAQTIATIQSVGSSPTREIHIGLLDGVALVLCALWLAGVIWRLSVAVGSGMRVAQIRRGCVPDGNRDGISIYSSSAVELPLSIGFARPAIVLPKRFLDVLTPESLECIVQHEVAHVLRKDVWTKTAQVLLEALLFFNPAALFIGRKISFEREAACDDRALASISDVRHYADCLARVASLVSQTHVSAGVALGFGNTTVARVRRLMDERRNGHVSISSLTVGGSVMILATIAFALQTLAPVIAFSGASQQPPVIAQATALATPLVVKLAGPSRPAVVLAPIKVKLNCNAAAGVTDPAVPEYPAELKSSKTPLKVLVAVNIDAKGRLTQARVTRSSGNGYADKSALKAARESKYSPAYRNCRPVSGTYIYRVDFSASGSK